MRDFCGIQLCIVLHCCANWATGTPAIIFKNKTLTISLLTTNQAVGSSNLSGRANIHESYQAVIQLVANRILFQYHQCRSFAGLSITDPVCCLHQLLQFRGRVMGCDVAIAVTELTVECGRTAYAEFQGSLPCE